jgi:hypothetical protein
MAATSSSKRMVGPLPIEQLLRILTAAHNSWLLKSLMGCDEISLLDRRTLARFIQPRT